MGIVGIWFKTTVLSGLVSIVAASFILCDCRVVDTIDGSLGGMSRCNVEEAWGAGGCHQGGGTEHIVFVAASEIDGAGRLPYHAADDDPTLWLDWSNGSRRIWGMFVAIGCYT